MRECIPLDVCWDIWDTCGCGSLCRRDRCAGAGASNGYEAPQSWYKAAKWLDVRSFAEIEHVFKSLAKDVSKDGCQQSVSFYSMPKREPHSVPGSRQDLDLLSARQALTLQGAQQVVAILRGKKLIENRAWRIPMGWYAIHAGAQTINEERAARIRSVWPDAPAEASWRKVPELHGVSFVRVGTWTDLSCNLQSSGVATAGTLPRRQGALGFGGLAAAADPPAAGGGLRALPRPVGGQTEVEITPDDRAVAAVSPPQVPTVS
eukprot:s1178_g5.t1